MMFKAYETNNNKPIAHINPHYTDTHYSKPRTVYLAQGQTLQSGYSDFVEGAHYDYSDRLAQWNWDKFYESRDAVKDAGYIEYSANYFEAWLRLFFDDPTLKLVHIMAGYNQGNGFPYQVFGYIREGGES